MKIAMVSGYASPLPVVSNIDAGGEDIHIAELSAALVRRGHSVTVFTRRASDRLHWEQMLPSGVALVNIDAGPPRAVVHDRLLPYIPEFAERLGDYWTDEVPHVVHGHSWMSGIACIEAVGTVQKSGLPPPVVVETFHTLGPAAADDADGSLQRPPEREFLEPWVARSVDRVIAISTDEVFDLSGLGVDLRRIALASSGVDTAVFTPDGPARSRGTRFRLATIGRLTPRAGTDTVIRALGLLAAAGREDFELLVVGGVTEKTRVASDPEVRRLRELAEALGVGRQVIFAGRVPREAMPGLLRSLDVAVCSMRSAPSETIPLEAMASAVPTVGAAVGSLAEVIVDGVTGIHVPPDDPRALARAIVTLADDPALRDRLGEAALDRARTRYTWDHVASTTEGIYRSIRDHWEQPEAEVARSRSLLRRVGDRG